MASGHGVPHQQAGRTAAPTSLARPCKKTLPTGAVHTWHFSEVAPFAFDGRSVFKSGL
jgi:hypothetical protein